jgi:hypothetical protein
MSKRLVALPVALIAIAAFAPGMASAASFNTTTTFAIASSGKAFTGKVSSPKGSCVPNRTVTLQRKLAGQTTFAKIGTDKTDSQGKWSVSTTPKNGAQFRAVVASRKVSGNTCKAVTSKTLTARSTNSTIAINSLGNAFTGKVSAITACVSGRTVKLQRKNPGATAFTNVGTPDTTASNGAWSVATNPVNNAQYRASVAAKTAGANACMAGLSKTTKAIPTTLTIQQGGSTNFHGNVNSAVAACKSNRTVTLQRKTIYETTFHNVGSDASSSTGVWQVPTAVVSGASYRGSVSAKQTGTASCLDDLSPVVVAS